MVDGGPWAGGGWSGSRTRGGSTAVMDNMRLHRRPVGSALVVVWQRILFQKVPGGMLRNGSVWALGLRGNERRLGARRELEGGHAESGQGGFHRWSVVGVAIVLVRGAKTDPHGWALVVEAEQGLEGVVGDEVVVLS